MVQNSKTDSILGAIPEYFVLSKVKVRLVKPTEWPQRCNAFFGFEDRSWLQQQFKHATARLMARDCVN